jgi:hypothetical protein
MVLPHVVKPSLGGAVIGDVEVTSSCYALEPGMHGIADGAVLISCRLTGAPGTSS